MNLTLVLSKAEFTFMVWENNGRHRFFHVYLQFTPGLPKTRSGKIMRRILRKVAANKPDELGDTSTLFDPSIVEAIVTKHEMVYGKKA